MSTKAETAQAVYEAIRWCLRAEFGIDLPEECRQRAEAYAVDALTKFPVREADVARLEQRLLDKGDALTVWRARAIKAER